MVICSIAVMISIVFFYRTMILLLEATKIPHNQQRLLVAGSVFFYSVFVSLKRIYGLDVPFLLMFGTLYCWEVLRHGALESKRRDILVQGTLLGCLILSRFDSLSLVAAFLAVQFILVYPERSKALAVVLRGAIAGVTLIPWVIWSVQSFGTWMPVSAKIKTSFPHPDILRSLDTFLHTSISKSDQMILMVILVIVLFCFGVFAQQIRLGRRLEIAQNRSQTLLFMFTTYLLGRLVFLFMFSRVDVQGGYFILGICYLLYVLIAGLSWAQERGRRSLIPIACVGLLLTPIIILGAKAMISNKRLQKMGREGFTNEIELAGQIGDLVGKDGVLFGGQFGIMGYFSDRPWVNRDGVIHNYAFQEAIRDKELHRYLRRAGVSHIVMFYQGELPKEGIVKLDVPAHLYGVTEYLEIPVGNIVLETRLVNRGAGKSLIVAKWE